MQQATEDKWQAFSNNVCDVLRTNYKKKYDEYHGKQYQFYI